MHGLIFTYVQKFVQKEFGAEVWKSLLVDAGLEKKSFSPAKSYPDEDAVAIVGAAAKLLELPTQTVLTTIGRGIGPDLLNLYRTKLPPDWRTIDLIENLEGIIHSVVRVGNPGARPPVLDCIRDGQDKIQIIYSSHRQMCGLLGGIVEGLAKQYREIIAIEKTACMLDGAPYCVFELTKTGNYDDTIGSDASPDQTIVAAPGEIEKKTLDSKAYEFDVVSPVKTQMDQSIRSDIEAIKLLAQVNSHSQLSMIKHFRVISLLGAGGMGIVYQAEDSRLGRTVAVKLLRPSLMKNDSIRLRFIREAKAMVAIDSPQIATVYDIGSLGDLPYMVMECLQGQTLDEKLGQTGKFSIQESLRVAGEIAQGIQSLHRSGYLHRDLKPSNIWIESPTDKVKLLDFGVVRAIGGHSQQDITKVGGVVGTPAYMAPEQARGEAEIDERCDVFSLGCIFYWMLCGHPPFSIKPGEPNDFPTLWDTPATPAELEGISIDLSNLVMSMLEKDKSSRPASMEEVLKRFDAIVV